MCSMSSLVPVTGREGAGRGDHGGCDPTRPVTFSVDTQAPMVEPELTEVGELHSLTDWQVSEASEEAELDEFCSGEGPHEGTEKNQATRHQEIIIKIKESGWGRTHRETDIYTKEGR